MDMTSNKEHYLTGIGDKYYIRRREALESFADNWLDDPIIKALVQLDIKVGKYLEIGCADGWRLHAISKNIGLSCYGVEPSLAAINNAKHGCIERGTADSLDFSSKMFEVVAFGFCLYCCDDADLFKIISEADRVVTDDGYIIVFDFYSRDVVYKPNPDCPIITTRKMDYSKMLEWHPSYTQVYRQIEDVKGHGYTLVSVFKKKKG